MSIIGHQTMMVVQKVHTKQNAPYDQLLPSTLTRLCHRNTMANPIICHNITKEKGNENQNPPQQPPNTPPNYNKHTYKSLPYHTITLLLTLTCPT